MTQHRELPDAGGDHSAAAIPQHAVLDRPRRRVASVVFVCWIFQIVVFAVIGLWIFLDSEFARLLHSALAEFAGPSIASDSRFLGIGGSVRVWMLRALFLGVLLSLLGAIIGLAIGSKSQRRVTAWLAVTAMIAGWLTLASTWKDLAWSGQRWRVTQQVEQLVPIARSLQASWPTEDGERRYLGTFMAYPRDDPRVLMMIAQPDGIEGASFVSVERSKEGALRFELAGGETGAWLEWHPPGDRPSSFVGGLETEYLLNRSAPIGDGWYVTRYLVQQGSREL